MSEQQKGKVSDETTVQSHFVDKASEPTAFELAHQAGLIGVAKNAPSDLSTNRKHFEGFGRS
jgi:hypothetical protein